jgi:hypothetical protein
MPKRTTTQDPPFDVDLSDWIAAKLFDYDYPDNEERPSEETCVELGRTIARKIFEVHSPQTCTPAHLFDYSLTGQGYFPLDMLRYDRAWPAREIDEVQIRMGEDDTRSFDRSVRVIGLTEPTEQRWESFGWTVHTITRTKSIK